MAYKIAPPTLAEKRARLLALLDAQHKARNALQFLDRPPPRVRDVEQMPEHVVDMLLNRFKPSTAQRPRCVW